MSKKRHDGERVGWMTLSQWLRHPQALREPGDRQLRRQVSRAVAVACRSVEAQMRREGWSCGA